MPKLPTIKAKDLIKILQSFGYKIDRIKGSHHIMRNDAGLKTTIPVHGNSEIPKGTLIAILYDLKIDKEEFVKILKKK